MNQNSNSKCDHHPAKYQSAIAKFLSFLFRRKHTLNSFKCQSCDAELNVPPIYYSPLIRLCYFFFSVAATLIFVCNACSENILSRLSPLAILSLLYLTIYGFYRLVSSMIFAFGSWSPLQSDHCTSTQSENLSSYNWRISSIMTTGIFLAQMLFRDRELPVFLSIVSIIVVILGLTKKIKGYIVAGVALLLYSIFPLFFSSELAVQLKYINYVFATLSTIILVVSK